MKTEQNSTRLFIRIAVVFGLVIVAYYAFATTDWYETWIFQPYVRINADLSAALLALFGEAGVSAGEASVSSPRFALVVGRGCDGLEPTALFVAALLAFPASFAAKLPAFVLGVPLLAGLNLIRIVSLFWVGIYFPKLFHTMHVEVWQLLYIAVALVFFVSWLAWATRRSAPEAVVRDAP